MADSRTAFGGTSRWVHLRAGSPPFLILFGKRHVGNVVFVLIFIKYLADSPIAQYPFVFFFVIIVIRHIPCISSL